MQTLSIGRDATNNIVLNDNFVSRLHAQLILFDNGEVKIKDMGSSNGTFVNGEKTMESFLNARDTLKCANVFVKWQEFVNSMAPKQNPNVSTQQQIPQTKVSQLNAQKQNQVSQIPQEPQPQVTQAKSLQAQFQRPEQHQTHNQQNIIILGKQKSVGLAFFLAFFFGPLGLLYASVIGGIVMFFITIILFFLIPIVGGILGYVGCIIWAVIAAGDANKKMIKTSTPLIQNQY